LSGLFFKTYGGWFPFFKKKTNKLLIPFFFTFLFIIIPSSYLLSIKNGDEVSMSGLIYGGYGKFNLGIDGAAWFLICLFALNILFYLIFLISRQNIIAICILSCLCGITGYMTNCYNSHLPMWFDSALTATPFFMIGYIMRNYSNILYENITKKDYILCFIMFLVLIGVYLYDELQGTGIIAYGDNTFDISIISLYSGGGAGTFCILIISKYFKQIRGISYIGRYSIVVLLTHLIYMFIIRNILYQLRIPQDSISLNFFVFITIMLLELPTIKFCITYLPYFFAQKDLWK
jgi:fucose 4-O-acetylase-like acetyltransferase